MVGGGRCTRPRRREWEQQDPEFASFGDFHTTLMYLESPNEANSSGKRENSFSASSTPTPTMAISRLFVLVFYFYFIILESWATAFTSPNHGHALSSRGARISYYHLCRRGHSCQGFGTRWHRHNGAPLAAVGTPSTADRTPSNNNDILKDSLAGLTVAFSLLSKAIACSTIVGVNPLVGIWSSVVMGITSPLCEFFLFHPHAASFLALSLLCDMVFKCNISQSPGRSHLRHSCGRRRPAFGIDTNTWRSIYAPVHTSIGCHPGIVRCIPTCQDSRFSVGAGIIWILEWAWNDVSLLDAA